VVLPSWLLRLQISHFPAFLSVVRPIGVGSDLAAWPECSTFYHLGSRLLVHTYLNKRS
jgi:hypothetical protein